MAIPPDLSIGDIPPELILQLMPIFHKKYVGTDFSKFKCRIVGLGNHWKNVHGVDPYASMVRVDTVKFLFAVGSAMDYDFLEQISSKHF
jgi:hypothetical protein